MRWDFERKLHTFFILDVSFLMCGVASIAIGIWLYVGRNTYSELTPTSYSAFSAAGLCCFTGATMCIISIVGLFSIWIKNRILLITFIAFVILLGFLQTITGIVGLVHKENAKEFVRTDLLININRSHVLSASGRSVELAISWNQMQHSLECCGVDGPQDWFYSQRYPRNEFVPDSCCDPSFFKHRDLMDNCGKVPMDQRHWYKQGCYEPFVDWLFHHIRVVNWLSIVLIIVELFIIPVAICTCWEMGQLEEKSQISRDEERKKRLLEINERERQDLQIGTYDRVGDANWPEHEPPEDP